MKRFILILPFLCCACTTPPQTQPSAITQGIMDKAEKAAASASAWSLYELNRLNHTAAVDSAIALKNNTAFAVLFLTNPITQFTAMEVNKYLIQILIKDINPLIGTGIDAATIILDDVLGASTGVLTTVELDLLASFVRGLGAGADQFLTGQPASKPEAIKRLTKNPRFWLYKQTSDAGTYNKIERRGSLIIYKDVYVSTPGCEVPPGCGDVEYDTNSERDRFITEISTPSDYGLSTIAKAFNCIGKKLGAK
jgi:hypothetical protein